MYKVYTKYERAKKSKKKKDKHCKDVYNYYKSVYGSGWLAFEAYIMYLAQLDKDKPLRKRHHYDYIPKLYSYIRNDYLNGNDKGTYVHGPIRAMVRDCIITGNYEGIKVKYLVISKKNRWGV